MYVELRCALNAGGPLRAQKYRLRKQQDDSSRRQADDDEDYVNEGRKRRKSPPTAPPLLWTKELHDKCAAY
jgi:hypothetical protein